MTPTHVRRIRSINSHLVVGCLVIGSLMAQIPSASGSPTTGPRGDVVITIAGIDPTSSEGRTVQYLAKVNTDNTFELQNASSAGTNWSLTDLDVSGNVDPFASLNFAVTNNAAVTLLFTVSVTVPIAPQGPATLHGGSVGGTLTDANFNGVASVATVAGVPLYRGQIDGATALSIYPPAYSQSVAFAGQSFGVPALNPGLPGPNLLGGPALNTIGIINQFTLTAGDIYSGNSFFVVEAVPEPSTLALLAVSLAAVAIVARRRTSLVD